MSLKKEIKENKWGIILGGIWSMFSFWIGSRTFLRGINLPGGPLIYIIFLPAWLFGYSIMVGNGLLLILSISQLPGMAIGYFVSKLIKVIK